MVFSRRNENRPVRLGTSGRGTNGQLIIRVRSRAVDGAGALEEERGDDIAPFIITSNH